MQVTAINNDSLQSDEVEEIQINYDYSSISFDDSEEELDTVLPNLLPENIILSKANINTKLNGKEDLDIDYTKSNDELLNECLFYSQLILFLNSYFHSTLYLSGIYSEDLYYLGEQYGLEYIKYIRDKDIVMYIDEFLDSIRVLLKNREILKSISIVIYSFDSEDEQYNKEQSDWRVHLEVKIELKKFYHEYSTSYSKYQVEIAFKSLLSSLYTNFIKKEAINDLMTFRFHIEIDNIVKENNKKVYNRIQKDLLTNYLTNLNLNMDTFKTNQITNNRKLYSIGYFDLSNVELDITLIN